MKALIVLACFVALIWACLVVFGIYKARKLAKEMKARRSERRTQLDKVFSEGGVSGSRVTGASLSARTTSRDATSDALVTAAIVSSYDSGGYGGGYGCSSSSSSSDSGGSSCSSD